jgi:hypothetical protein
VPSPPAEGEKEREGGEREGEEQLADEELLARELSFRIPMLLLLKEVNFSRSVDLIL